MDIKQRAYDLRATGLSFKKVADRLGISKTRAFEYVKEIRLSTGQTATNGVPAGSELIKEQYSERSAISPKPIPIGQASITKEVADKPTIKEFTGDELINKKFDSLEFTGKFLELIGKPSRHFSGIIWGLPKGGKSNFSLRFADYLQEYFGKVAYIAAEEGESVTLQEKFKQIGGSKVTVVESSNRDEIRGYLPAKDFDFVFIDSINNAGIDNEFLEILKDENPKKSFLSVVQATKGGNFKGDQALTHNCDFIIKVVDGVAYHTGRFGVAADIKIFEGPLYAKNVNARETANRLTKDQAEKAKGSQETTIDYLSSADITKSNAPLAGQEEEVVGLQTNLKTANRPNNKETRQKVAQYVALTQISLLVVGGIYDGISKWRKEKRG